MKWFGSIGWIAFFCGTIGSALGQGDTPAARATNSVKIPFEVRRGHIMIRAPVNDSAPLLFMLDTGFAINMISPEQAAKLGLKATGKITIIGVAGEEQADTFEGVTLDFGGMIYKPRRLAALASHSSRSSRRDGVLGSGFYRRFVVEVDHAAKSMVLHEPASFEYSGKGEVVPLRFRRSTPIISASILFPEQPPIRAEMEIDTGCDGGLCLGRGFVDENQLEQKLPPGERSARQGVGGGARTRTVKLPQLQMGKLIVERPTAELFEKGSPADDGLAGHLGMEILRNFRVIFDYSRKQMILESYPSKAE